MNGTCEIGNDPDWAGVLCSMCRARNLVARNTVAATVAMKCQQCGEWAIMIVEPSDAEAIERAGREAAMKVNREVMERFLGEQKPKGHSTARYHYRVESDGQAVELGFQSIHQLMNYLYSMEADPEKAEQILECWQSMGEVEDGAEARREMESDAYIKELVGDPAVDAAVVVSAAGERTE
jgi:Tfp pilus assembly protein PilE